MYSKGPLLLFLATGVTALVSLAAVVGLSRHVGDAGAMLARPTPPWLMAVAPSSAVRTSGHRVQAMRDADGLFYVTVGVNGHPLRFVVDTGASMMVLSGADAATAGVTPQAESTAVTTADGSASMNMAVVARVNLAGLSLRDVPASVAPSGKVSLIGENILAQLQSVSIHGDRIELN
jgi:aspartyl protease family protein